ncbi:alpha/beta fold hydrolase [Nonomuraea fastidiosa]|uniref:alpha/beta fold hydrolase n=1 Tax=Nonomuraea TaxID=83681 RepID=UPI00324FA115
MPPQDDTTAPAATETKIVRAGDFEVGVIESGSGVPLVLVHGGESDRTQFTALRSHFGPGIRAISYDQRDSGVTVNPPHPYTMADLADDVVALLDALDLPQAHLLGTSFGGAVAQHAALRHPERIASLILVATAPSWAMQSGVADELLSMSYEERQRKALDLFFTPQGQAAQGDRVKVLVKRSPEQNARREQVIQQHEVRDRLPEITVPTLIVHGSEDRLAPFADAQLMEKEIPNARMRVIEGGRHAIATEFPDTIARWVREFIGVDA